MQEWGSARESAESKAAPLPSGSAAASLRTPRPATDRRSRAMAMDADCGGTSARWRVPCGWDLGLANQRLLYSSLDSRRGQGMNEQLQGSQPETEQGKYVYCIIKTDTPRDFGTVGIGGRGDRVYSVHYRE